MIIAVQTRAAAVVPDEQPHEAGVTVPGPVVEVIAPPACTETTAAGDPCKGRPGEDGLCAAHKRKDDSDAEVEVAVDADPPAEKGGKAEEVDG